MTFPWHAESIRALCGSFIGLTTIAVGLRFYVRLKQRMPLLADDWLMLSAWATFVSVAAGMLYGVHIMYFGYATSSIPPEHYDHIARSGTWIDVGLMLVEMPMFAFTKLSALFFYRRIFDAPGPGLRLLHIIIWITVAIVICWAIACLFALAFACGTHFVSINSWAMVYKYCNVVTPVFPWIISDMILDVWVILLPIPWILRLNINNKRKIGLVCVFLTAGVGLGAAVARMIWWTEMEHILHVNPDETDSLRVGSICYSYDILETGMTIIAINLPTFSGVILRALPDVLVNSIRDIIKVLSSASSRSTHDSNKSNSIQDDKGSASSDESFVERIKAPGKTESVV